MLFNVKNIQTKTKIVAFIRDFWDNIWEKNFNYIFKPVKLEYLFVQKSVYFQYNYKDLKNKNKNIH